MQYLIIQLVDQFVIYQYQKVVLLSNNNSLQSDVRLKVIRLLETNSQLSKREMAKSLGVSLGKLNYVLNALIEKGVVKTQNFTRSDNKRAYAYLLTTKGLAEKASLTRNFLYRKIEEYDLIKKEIAELRKEINNTGDLNNNE